jgi:Fe2+ or Zn2+ uptake regulation protein
VIEGHIMVTICESQGHQFVESKANFDPAKTFTVALLYCQRCGETKEIELKKKD